MVDMGMGQQNPVYGGGGYGDFLIFIFVRPLLHAAVNQNGFTAGLQQIAAAGYLVGRAEKGKLHRKSPFEHNDRNSFIYAHYYTPPGEN